MPTLDFTITDDWTLVADGSGPATIEHIGGENGALRVADDKPDQDLNRGHILVSGRIWNSDQKTWVKCTRPNCTMELVVTPGGS